MKKGFTLLETLIAIAIMTVAVGSAFGMAQKSLQTSYQIKNQTSAYFLAAEGLELVRNIRDNVALHNKETGDSLDWLSPLGLCTGTNMSCDINPASDFSNPSAIPADSIFSCSSPCKVGSTVFSRSIHVEIVNQGENREAVVTSAVIWPGNTASLTETLSNWQQI